jgi:mycoredoxin
LDDNRIILYGRPACAMVPPVRNTLERAGAAYEYVDIYSVLEARERVREINNGNESVPTLVFPDGSTLIEPSAGQLQAKLQSLGYEIRSPTLMEWLQFILQHPIVLAAGALCIAIGMISETDWILFVGVVVLGLGLLVRRFRVS